VNAGVFLVIGATFIFSCGGLFVKLAAVPPSMLVGWRTVVPFLIVTLLRPTIFKSVFTQPNRILLCASVISLVRVSVWVKGLLVIPMSKAIVVLYVWPLIFTVLGWVFLGERITLRIGLLLLLGFCGVALMGLDPSIFSDSQQRLGLLLMLGVATLNAVNYALFKGQLRQRNPDEVLLYDNLVGAVLFLPFVASQLADVPAASIVWLVCYGGVLGCFGYYLLYAGLKRVRAATAGVLSYVEVLFAGVLGVFVLGEHVTPHMVASTAMILSAALMITTEIRAQTHTPQPKQ
jgi:drug/metabolite transporter (DMT)-like permease